MTALPAHCYLDVHQARDVLAEMGIVRSYDAVRKMAEQGRLPFFKAPDGRLGISEEDLRLAYLRPKLEARRTRRAREPIISARSTPRKSCDASPQIIRHATPDQDRPPSH